MKRRLPLVFVVIALASAMLACSLLGSKNQPENNPGETPAAAQPDQGSDENVSSSQTEEQPVSRGSGDFDLADPGVGLDGLQSYRQALQIGFDGTVSGEAQQSQTSLTRVVTSEPPATLTWLSTNGQPEQFFGKMGELSYAQPAPDQACGAASIVADPSSEPAPAAFTLTSLPPVYGAVAAGDEEVNGVAAKHYTFDEQAIGYAGQAKASGELWVAAQGGYVLRYTLSLDAPADLLGPGAAGTQTWNYELSEVDSVTGGLPEGCQALESSSQIPLPEGAVVTLNLPGYMEFQVAASLEDTLAFYQAQAESLGWKAEEPVQFEQVTRLALRPTDGSLAQLSLRADGDNLIVTVQTLAPEAPAE